VFHHLYHAQPRKVYPREASEMVGHEDHASWTGVDSLNIQHLDLCQSLMLQARQLLKRNKGIGLQQEVKDMLKWSAQNCSRLAITLHTDTAHIKTYCTQRQAKFLIPLAPSGIYFQQKRRKLRFSLLIIVMRSVLVSLSKLLITIAFAFGKQ